MKISQDTLESNKLSVPASAVLPENLPEIRGVYGVNVKPDQRDPLYLYGERGAMYVKRFGYVVVRDLKDAMDARARESKAVTPREADTAARGKLKLDHSLIHKALFVLGGLIHEGLAGTKENPFALRAFYNRGVDFFRSGKSKLVSFEQRDKALFHMQETLLKLESKQVPAWTDEVSKGFPIEFCKPEFMTWAQYEAVCKSGVILRDASLEKNEDGSEPEVGTDLSAEQSSGFSTGISWRCLLRETFEI